MPNWIDFRLLPKNFQKIFSAIFGPFSPSSHFFDLSKLKFALKTSIFIQRKILEARFSPPNSAFYSPFSSSIFSILLFSALKARVIKRGRVLGQRGKSLTPARIFVSGQFPRLRPGALSAEAVCKSRDEARGDICWRGHLFEVHRTVRGSGPRFHNIAKNHLKPYKKLCCSNIRYKKPYEKIFFC